MKVFKNDLKGISKIGEKKGHRRRKFHKAKKKNTESIIPPQRYEKCCFFYSIRDKKKVYNKKNIWQESLKKRKESLGWIFTHKYYIMTSIISLLWKIFYLLSRHHQKYFGGFFFLFFFFLLNRQMPLRSAQPRQ